MFFSRFLQIMICILMIQCLHLCTAISNDNLQLKKMSTTTVPTIWTQLASVKKNGIDEFSTQPTLDKELRGLRLNMFGGSSRNMTINLTNLVVLGLGMAAAVSLFSFFENPALNLKRSMPDKNENSNMLNSLIDGLFTTIFNEDFIDQVEKKLSPKKKFSDWLLKDHFEYNSSTDETPNIKQNLFENFRELLSEPIMKKLLNEKT